MGRASAHRNSGSHLRIGRRAIRHASFSALATLCFCALFARGTQDAIANGETRTLDLFHAHTQESLRITFKRDGTFDSDALKKLNWFLRDWRVNEETAMSPRLFDILWYVYREAGAGSTIKVMSAYRSPGTNEALRRRSRAVAKESQHIQGNAMDVHVPGVSMAKVREIAMRLQRGGVGYYPTAGSPFVHLDVGTVRSWPRMNRDQLERLFPDGKTVHLPRDGKPLANYQLALAEVQARGDSALDYDTITSRSGKSLWALLFGSGGDEGADRDEPVRPTRNARNSRGRQAPQQVALAPVPNPSLDNVMQVAPIAAVPQRRVEPVLRPQPGSEPAPVRAPEPVLAAPVTAPPPVAAPSIQIAALPVPPIRPRSLNAAGLAPSEETLTTAMPLPPIRPPGIAERSQLAALAGNAASLPAPAPEPKAQPSALPVPPQRALVAAVPEPRPEPDQAPQRVAGLPIPPARPRAVEPAAPIEPAPTVVAGMPEPPRRASFTVASVTPQSVPAQPPQKNVLADAKPLLAAKPELTPESTAQGFAAAPPPRPARPAPAIRPIATRKTVDPEARASLRSATRGRLAAPDRPDYVITVEQPKVAEEVRRGVVAMKLGQAPQIPANGGFSGRFIQPLGASFTRTGE